MRCREREWSNYRRVKGFKGTQMGPLLVLVCPCSRGNVILTCKIVPFLCNLDNFLLKNVIISFFGNQISKWCSFEKKRLFLTYFSHFLVTRENTHSFSTYLTYIRTRILLTLLTFFFFLTLPILQKLWFYHVWFLFGVTPCVDSYSRHFGAVNKLQNGEQNLGCNVYYWYLFTLMQNL